MTNRVGQAGQAITFGQYFRQSGVLTNPYLVANVGIFDVETGGVAIDTVTPSNIGTGTYDAEWTPGAGLASGIYYDEWTVTALVGTTPDVFRNQIQVGDAVSAIGNLLSDVPGEFAVPDGITISRDSGGTWTNGRFTAGARTATTGVVASFQPLRGREIELLPEGDRDKRSGKLYTATEIKSADRALELMADQILFDGDTWEVRSVEKHYYGGYYKAIVIRVGD